MPLPASHDVTVESPASLVGNGSTVDAEGDVNHTGSADFDLNVVETYFLFCLLAVLAIIGTCGNAVVLNVFSRPSKRDRACPGASATVYVLALAVADLITCLVVIPSTIYVEHVQYYISSDFVCKFYQFLITSTIPFSSLVMVAIAVDRYICICHPLRQATLATGYRARAVVLSLALFAAALGVCGALMFGVNHRVDGTLHNEPFQMTGSYRQQVSDDPTSHPFQTNVTVSSAVISTVEESSLKASRREEDSIETSQRSRFGAARSNCGSGGDEDGGSQSCGNVGRTMTYEVIDYSDSWPIINTGFCGANNLILGTAFNTYYLVIHSDMYPLCLAAVVVLYGLIYRSVLARRARRQRLRSPASPRPAQVAHPNGRRQSVTIWTRASMSLTVLWTKMSWRSSLDRERHPNGSQQASPSISASLEDGAILSDEASNAKRYRPSPNHNDIELVTVRSNADHAIEITKNENSEEVTVTKQLYGPLTPVRDPRAVGNGSGSGIGGGRSTDPRRTLLTANLRTAAMLFVVTVVFVVCYTPAFLMSVELVQYHRVLFYMYFVNSVANPVVYSFMNRYFRQELRTILCRPVESYYRRSNL